MFGLLKQRCTITRNVLGAVGKYGDKAKVPTVQATGVACLFQQMGASETPNWAVRFTEATDWGYLMYGVDLVEKDTCTLTTGGSTVFEIVAVDENVAGQQHHVECVAKRVKIHGV